MKPEQYEALSRDEKRKFILSQNPVIRRYKSVTATEKSEYGDHHYAYRLDNGWKCCLASDIDSVKAKFEAQYN